MKKITFLLLLSLIGSSINAQESNFKFDIGGFTDFVVVQCNDLTQEDLYKKTLDWISVTYKTPREVIKAQIENEYIRIEGSSNSLICLQVMGKTCSNATYQIEISFKTGKYKFDVIEVKQYSTGSNYAPSGWVDVPLHTTEQYYNKNGKIRNVFKYYPEMIPSFFNNLNASLENIIKSKEILSLNSDW